VGLLLNGVVDVSEGLRIMAKYIILAGLFIVSISREPIEDERIKNLRMQSYSTAFLVAVLYAICIPILVYVVDLFQGENSQFKDVGDFMILWVLLAIQIFYFTLKKRQIA